MGNASQNLSLFFLSVDINTVFHRVTLYQVKVTVYYYISGMLHFAAI